MKTTTTKTTAEKTEKTTKTTEERKETTMKKNANETRAAAAKKAIEAAKNGATREDRAKNAERAAKLIAEFNAESLENAVLRGSFLAAAEAVRPDAPQKVDRREKGVDYDRRAEKVTFQWLDDNANESTRVLSLPVYARAAFAKTATEEQRAAFAVALTAVERFQKNNVENEDAKAHEGLKEAAQALTALAKACGLDALTMKTAANGEKYPFYIDRSFIHAAAARMRCKKGVYTTEAAAITEAAAAAVNASDKNHDRAAARVERAEAAAVKMVFSIINDAAAAAVVGRWKAVVMTAEAAKKAAEERAKKAAEERAARDKKAAERAAKKAAAEKVKQARAEAAKKAAKTAPKKTEQAKKTAAKKTAPKTEEAKKTTAA